MHKTLQTPILSCMGVLLLGYVTGLELARIAPYALRLNAEYGLSLAGMGWLTSLVTVFVATLAIPASRIIPRIGLVRSIKVSGMIMTTGAILFVFAPNVPTMFAARAVEGAGHLIAVVAAPSYLATQAPEHLRRIFLALWGSFVPVGFALSGLLGGVVQADTDLMLIWAIYAMPMIVAAIVVLAIPHNEHSHSETQLTSRRTAPIAWILVFAFGFYAYLSIGFFTFIPTLLEASSTGGLSAATTALFVPMGSFSAAIMFARLDKGLSIKMMVAGFTIIAVAAMFIFPAISADGSTPRAIYAFACGITAASILASVPTIAKTHEAVTRTIGAIAQAGGAMVLLGAPIGGFILDYFGWKMLGWSFSAMAGVIAFAVCMAIFRAKFKMAV